MNEALKVSKIEFLKAMAKLDWVDCGGPDIYQDILDAGFVLVDQKALEKIANLKEFDEMRFKRGTTTTLRVRLLVRAELAKEILEEKK